MLLYTAKTLATMQQFAVLGEGGGCVSDDCFNCLACFFQPMSLLKGTVTYGVFFLDKIQ